MDVGQYIKHLRINNGYSQEELGQLLGVKRAAVQKWESGMVQNLKRDIVKKMSEIFSVSPSSFIDPDFTANVENGILPVTVKTIPLFTEISCGEPIYSNEDIKCYVPVGENVEADFCVIANGDSMTGARINDGDVIFVKKVNEISDGDIAAVWIDGEGALLKRVYIQNGVMSLVSENPKYPPRIYPAERAQEVRLLGKAIAFQSNIE